MRLGHVADGGAVLVAEGGGRGGASEEDEHGGTELEWPGPVEAEIGGGGEHGDAAGHGRRGNCKREGRVGDGSDGVGARVSGQNELLSAAVVADAVGGTCDGREEERRTAAVARAEGVSHRERATGVIAQGHCLKWEMDEQQREGKVPRKSWKIRHFFCPVEFSPSHTPLPPPRFRSASRGG